MPEGLFPEVLPHEERHHMSLARFALGARDRGDGLEALILLREPGQATRSSFSLYGIGELLGVAPTTAAEILKILGTVDDDVGRSAVLLISRERRRATVLAPPIVEPAGYPVIDLHADLMDVDDDEEVLPRALFSKRDAKEKKKRVQMKGDSLGRGDTKKQMRKKFAKIKQPAGRGHRRG